MVLYFFIILSYCYQSIVRLEATSYTALIGFCHLLLFWWCDIGLEVYRLQPRWHFFPSSETATCSNQLSVQGWHWETQKDMCDPFYQHTFLSAVLAQRRMSSWPGVFCSFVMQYNFCSLLKRPVLTSLAPFIFEEEIGIPKKKGES